jgi:hypothetical protein
MNYLAHGMPFVDEPYILAGTAVPDWLSVVDRKVRVRTRQAGPHMEHADRRVAALAAGIVRHHADDAWFHETAAFAEASLELTVSVRQVVPADQGFRPSFLGHILVEILLDAWLMAEQPGLLDRYYGALLLVEPSVVEDAVNLMAPRPTDRLAAMVRGFCQSRFLYDYTDDVRLTFRLNQVMRRVGLEPLPEGFEALLPAARDRVAKRAGALLPPPERRPVG